MNSILLKLSFITGAAVLMVACKKNNFVVDQDLVPPTFVKFNTLQDNDTASNYFIRSVNNTFKLPIGLTTVSDKDRTIQITYSSGTAVQGVQYTGPASITIPAGKTLDTLTIQGLYAGYSSANRIDTLKITLGGGDVPTSSYKGSYTLYMRKYCTVDINVFKGDYKHTIERFGTGQPYGPYTTTVSSITNSTPTSARIAVTNIWDTGWGPIEFDLDWSDPANHKVTVVPKSSGIGDGGDINSAYAGAQVAVQAFSGKDGTFNACDQTITLNMQLGLAGLGWFNSLYTVTMTR